MDLGRKQQMRGILSRPGTREQTSTTKIRGRRKRSRKKSKKCRGSKCRGNKEQKTRFKECMKKSGGIRRRKQCRKERKSEVKSKTTAGTSAYPPWYGRCNRPLPVNSNQKNNCGGSHTLTHPLTFISYQEVVEQHFTEGRGHENWCCFKILHSRNECSQACENEANKKMLLPPL